MDTAAPDPKERFLHRDLSWLAFNERVLEESLDENNPLLERARFLAIAAGNLDEFFMVRFAGLKRLCDAGYNKKDAFGYFPQELYTEVRARIDALISRGYGVYKDSLAKGLAKQKISLRTSEEFTAEQKKYAKRYFESTVFPIITPMAVDQGHPFPVLSSRTIAFAVSLMRRDQPHLAILPVPKVIPRLLKLPSEKDESIFVLIDELIRQQIDQFFRGYKIISFAAFRLMRDSELIVDEEYAPDLLRAIEGEVKKRHHAKVVWLEAEQSFTDELLSLLCPHSDGLDSNGGLCFSSQELARIQGPLDLTFLFELASQSGRGELLFKSIVPAQPAYENIFDKIKEGDFLIHVPYQSFQPTLDLIREASRDENVLAIKMTLYRTDEDSAIVAALKEAGKNKKQVTVLVEIKARFDEEKNIAWAKELEEAGCHVIYGMPGMKIHSKMTLVVRREEEGIKRYVHLSTGNYNEKTARVYTDIGYFTANDDFARDISDVFNVITGYSLPSRWKRLVSSPNDLRQYFFELIDKEIEFHKKYRNGLITAKMNALEDTPMIEKLYEASAAGVKVKLLVRGVCCLLPQKAGMSETIEVKSIVGRFLEHSRIYLFNNNGDSRVFLSSADWMTRNLDRRIELLFEVQREELKSELRFVLENCWRDSVKARQLNGAGTYTRPPKDERTLNAQEALIQHYAG